MTSPSLEWSFLLWKLFYFIALCYNCIIIMTRFDRQIFQLENDFTSMTQHSVLKIVSSTSQSAGHFNFSHLLVIAAAVIQAVTCEHQPFLHFLHFFSFVFRRGCRRMRWSRRWTHSPCGVKASASTLKMNFRRRKKKPFSMKALHRF